MRIVDKATVPMKITDIPYGACFKRDDYLYIKTNLLNSTGIICERYDLTYAVNINTGFVMSLYNTAIVDWIENVEVHFS